jgi:hypothetical protein
MSTALQGLPRTVLRLHRTALILWGLFVAGLIGWLVWLTEVDAAHIQHLKATCAPDVPCDIPYLGWAYGERVGYAAWLVCYGFLAVAAFAGSALIARELESGTAHLAWSQGITPTRWLLTKLAVPALVLTAGDSALVLAFRWAWSPHRELRYGDDWAFDGIFVARGPATVAYALCALAVGALTALVLRRTLPALAVSIAAMGALHLTLTLCRRSLWPTVTHTSATRFDVSNSAWQVEWGRTGTGGHYTTYHPPSHFWPLHLVETGIVLAVTAAATVAAFVLLRRRTA